MIRARIYLGTRPLVGEYRPDRMAVGWTVALGRIRVIADRLARLHVLGATITPAVGLWDGALEPSFTIELLGDYYTEESVRVIAESLREDGDQDSVWWTMETVALSGSALRKDDPSCTD